MGISVIARVGSPGFLRGDRRDRRHGPRDDARRPRRGRAHQERPPNRRAGSFERDSQQVLGTVPRWLRASIGGSFQG